MRKFLLVMSLVAVAAIGYLAPRLAIASDPTPDLPESVPSSKLSRAPVPDATRLAIQSLIIDEVVERVGIARESYNNARVLATTERGPLYIIPGTKGACLALADVVGCREFPWNERLIIALFVPGVAGKYQVGGGLLATTTGQVVIDHGDGSTGVADAVEGGFVITPSHRVLPEDRVTVSGL